MAIEIKMPALSPTMEEGSLAKWLVKVGDHVSSGDLLAEIETDKATMEFEAVDEGVISAILVPEGTDGVKVGQVIALLSGEGQEAAPRPVPAGTPAAAAPKTAPVVAPPPAPVSASLPPRQTGARIKASPLARRVAQARGVDLARLTGSGPQGRIVRADVENSGSQSFAPVVQNVTGDPPFTSVKLTNMRKTIARRLTEAKQSIPHIYLTVDIQLDRLLEFRTQMNEILAPRGVKLSVNDLLIKALAQALMDVPACNVAMDGDNLRHYQRADISVAVSIPGGLITPIIAGANIKSLSQIAQEMADLAERARAGKLQPHEYQGGTASLSNMGMLGIKQFDAVINPPQAMIMAIGAGEERPYVVKGKLDVATVMSATGSFDHRAIDGADGAALMTRFKYLVETPLALIALEQAAKV